MNLPFYTIGHSNRTMEMFVDLLQMAEISMVVDIRSIPRSRTNPQYNQDALPATLAAYQIGYIHISELGGLRGKIKNAPIQKNGFWQNKSFQNYADYALSDDFRHGLDQLIALGRKQRCAMMCSEAVWWRCHRRIVTDYLLARDERVFHLMNIKKIDFATLTKGALINDGAISYPNSAIAD